MTSPLKSRSIPALVLGLSVAGLAAAACGLPASQAGTARAEASTNAGAGPVRCELVLDEARGSTTIQGRVSADRPVSGSYRLSISSSSSGGRSMINQSGEFEARPGAPAVLGETTLGGARAQYRADLELTLPGQRMTCSEGTGAQEL